MNPVASLDSLSCDRVTGCVKGLKLVKIAHINCAFILRSNVTKTYSKDINDVIEYMTLFFFFWLQFNASCAAPSAVCDLATWGAVCRPLGRDRAGVTICE